MDKENVEEKTDSSAIDDITSNRSDEEVGAKDEPTKEQTPEESVEEKQIEKDNIEEEQKEDTTKELQAMVQPIQEQIDRLEKAINSLIVKQPERMDKPEEEEPKEEEPSKFQNN